MKNLTSKQIAGAAFLLLLILAISAYFPFKAWRDNRELKASQLKIAQFDARNHIISVKDDLKIEAIIDETLKSGGMSDSDLNWLLDSLKKNNGAGLSQGLARSTILDPLEQLKIIPPAQEEKIYQAVIPMLGNDPAYNNVHDKIRASAVMRVLKDNRAIPYLLPLLNAPDTTDGQLRVHAQAALDAIGYKS